MTSDANKQVRESVVLIESGDRALGNGFIVHTDAQAAYVLTCRHITQGVDADALSIDGEAGAYLAEHRHLDLIILKVPGLKHRRPLPLADRAQTEGLFWVVGVDHDGIQPQSRALEVELRREVAIPLTGSRKEIAAWELDSFGQTVEPALDGAPFVRDGQAAAILQVNPRSGALKAISIAGLLHCWPAAPEEIARQLSRTYDDPPHSRYVVFTHLTREFKDNTDLIDRLKKVVHQADCQPIWLDTTDDREKEAWIKKAGVLICIQGVHFDERNADYMRAFPRRKGRYALIVGDDYRFRYQDILWDRLGAQWQKRDDFLKQVLDEVLADRQKQRIHFNDERELSDAVLIILEQSQLIRARPADPPRRGMFALPTDPPLPRRLFGRERELAAIDDWARSNRSTMLIWTKGGVGKTALVSHWLINHAPQILPQREVIWWSYGNNGSTVGEFLRKTNKSFDPEERMPPESYTKVQTLVATLKDRPFMLALDGMERLFDGYADPAQESDPQPDQSLYFSEQNDAAEKLLEELSRLPGAKILLTTRGLPAEVDDRLNDPLVLELPRLSDASIRDLLRALGAPADMTDAELDRLARTCNYNTQDIIGLGRTLWQKREA